MRPWREPGDTSFKSRTRGAPQSSQPKFSSKTQRREKFSPLIPTSRVSVPTQRLLVTTIFVAIQAIKLANLMAGSVGFFSKIGYTAIDVAFVWYLPAFAIPLLDFHPIVVCLQVAAISFLDYTLFVDSGWVWTTLSFISGIPTREQIPHQDPHEHLLGRYIVNILPDTFARMDTLEPLCIGAARTVAFAHITFNATWPSALQLWRGDFDGTLIETLNFTSKEIAKLPQKKNDELFVPLSRPGVYKLRTVQDAATGFAVGTQGMPLIVPPCPNARFEASEGPLCESDDFYDASLVLSGFPPLHAILSDGTEVDLPSDGSWNITEQDVLLRAPLVPYPASGQVGFAISSVSDGLGNVRDLDLKISAPVIRNPKLRVLSTDRFPLVDDSPVEVPIEAQGQDGPYILDILHNDTKISISNLNEGRQLLKISEPGHYNLLGVQGQHCSDDAEGSFEVWTPPPLDLSVEFEPVQDECAGPTGTMADLQFSGTPPFRLIYKVGNQVMQASFDSYAGRVQFKPPGAGYYAYEITEIFDKYRHKKLVGAQFRREQQIAEVASAAFSGQSNYRYCSGQAVFLRVNLKGKAPLTLEWKVPGVGGLRREEGLRGPYVDLDVGVLDGGDHQVELRRIIDSRGCSTQLDIKSPLVEVRTSPPLAKLGGPSSVFTLDPVDTRIPLDTDGIAPFQILYAHNGVTHTARLSDSYIQANEPGLYQLLEFSDSECPGIADDRVVDIRVHPRPTIELRPVEPVCISTEQHLEVTATGLAPFKIWHEIIYPNGYSEASEHVSLPRRFKLDAPANIGGQYIHKIWVADERYPKAEEAVGPFEVRRTTYDRPEAVFVRHHHREVCAGRTDQKSQPLSVELRGEPPFQLVFTASKKQQTVLTNLTRLDLAQYLPPFKPGKNIVSLESVRDAHGCERQLSAVETVIGRSAPSLSLPSKRDYCVGNVVKASMHGQQPFSVDVRVNDKVQRVSGSRTAHIIASQPGNMTFLTVKDEGGCSTPVDETVFIHSLPSSKITHEPVFNIHSGDTAELSFRFTGTPPFTFTYTRSVYGKVRERKTINKVTSHQHSIFTKEDGVYEVVALQDMYCRVEI